MIHRLIAGVVLCLLCGRGEVSAGSLLGNAGAGKSPSVFVQTTKVKNRARSLAGELSGSATRYWAVTDVDLQGAKSRAEKLARLTPPPVHARDGVRRYSAVIDTRNPLFLDLARQELVRVGTVEVQRGAARLEVTTIIENAAIYSTRNKNTQNASTMRPNLVKTTNILR